MGSEQRMACPACHRWIRARVFKGKDGGSVLRPYWHLMAARTACPGGLIAGEQPRSRKARP